jgi:poly(beta-D-mannuronate) lyase
LLPALAAGLLAAGLAEQAAAEGYGPATFDVEARRAELQQPEFAPARAACLAEIEGEPAFPEPVAALAAFDSVGADPAGAEFAGAVMVLAGRSLAGDGDATAALAAGLARWADAGALRQTPADDEPFRAMTRVLLPTAVAFRIVAGEMEPGRRALVEGWLDGLVRRLDTGVDVAADGHRYLADLVLMTWGSVIQDRDLFARGIARFEAAMDQARADGSLPLETRRGARAIWYSNLAVGELAMMLQVAELNGADLRRDLSGGGAFDGVLGYLASVLATPQLILPYAVENHSPGPAASYRSQDLGFTTTRGHGRHYMAWAESAAIQALDAPAAALIRAYAGTRLVGLRPLIDDYAGGNTTCFYWRPANGTD